MREKGFITTVGFDIPSIMPILVGLIIFFGMVSYSLTTVNNVNDQLELERNGLTISSALKQNGYLVKGTLQDLCEAAVNINTNFVAVVLDRAQLNNSSVFNSTVEELVMKSELINTGPSLTEKFESCISETVNETDSLQNRRAKIVYSYPLIYEETSGLSDRLKYRFLTVVLWK